MRGHRYVKQHAAYTNLAPLYLDAKIPGKRNGLRRVDVFVKVNPSGSLTVERNSQSVRVDDDWTYRVAVFCSPTRPYAQAMETIRERMPGHVAACKADQIF